MINFMVEFAHFSGLMLFTLICKFHNNKTRSKTKRNKEEEKKSVYLAFIGVFITYAGFDMMTFIFIAYLRQSIEIATDA